MTAKKCACGKDAVGLVSTLFGHKYVCWEHAVDAETKHMTVTYLKDVGQ